MPPRTRSVEIYDAADLRAELRRRKSAVPRLQRRRAALLSQIAVIDAELAGLGTAVAGIGSRKRPRNESSLPDALRAVLKGKTMGVREAAEAVQKAGYRTSSPNFRTIVNIALTKKSHFKRVGHGRYTAK
jgi:hypothetical protein